MKLARIESGIRAVLEFVQAFNRRDIAAMLQLSSDDCRLESAAPAPDARIEVEESFGFGFRCVVRWRCEWTSPAGQERLRGADIFQVRNGLIGEHLSYVKS